jgi:predicted metal-dependent phosphoesterase TrpH
LRIDLHSHSAWSGDSRATLREIIDAAVAADIDALALTDHDAIEGALQLAAMAPFQVIVGEEVMTSEGEIIGLFLTDWVPPGRSPEETVEAIHEQGGLVYVPHPFDRVRSSSTLRPPALQRIALSVDIVEVYNARCLLGQFNRQAAAFAAEHGLARGAGSDAHRAAHIGMALVEVPAFDGTAHGLLRSLADGEVQGRRLGGADRFAPSLDKAQKALAAWRRRAGGDAHPTGD